MQWDGANPQVVEQVPTGNVVAEVADEPRLVTEHESAYSGIHPVGANGKVERAGWGTGEVDVHSVSRVGDISDGVTKQILGALGA